MIDYNKIFNSFVAPGAFILLDSKHKLDFYIGIDSNGYKTLLLRTKIKPENVKSTSTIQVMIGQVKNTLWSISFHLTHDNMSGLFYKFCDDIVESSRDLPQGIIDVNYVIKRYNSWKKMFYTLRKDILSENEIMGLIGELLFLKNDLCKSYSFEEALHAWSGCDKTHKDFAIKNDWYEIKSSRASSLTVKISSVEQLDSDTIGNLVLFEFEKMSESFNGYTLNSVVTDVLNILPPELEDEFYEKLKNAGYNYDDMYNKYVYIIVSKSCYKVRDTFPRICKKNLHDGIVKVEYEILKKELENYKG